MIEIKFDLTLKKTTTSNKNKNKTNKKKKQQQIFCFFYALSAIFKFLSTLIRLSRQETNIFLAISRQFGLVQRVKVDFGSLIIFAVIYLFLVT